MVDGWRARSGLIETITSSYGTEWRNLNGIVTVPRMGGEQSKSSAIPQRSVFAYDHRRLDIGDSIRVMKVVQDDRPDVVINCAAWTDVDGCEGIRNGPFQ